MIEDVVIAYQRINDTIKLDDKFNLAVILTVGIEKASDYYLKLEFFDLSDFDFENVLSLSKTTKSIPIYSPFLAAKQFKINKIVVFNFSVSGNRSIVWEALSDTDFKLTISE